MSTNKCFIVGFAAAILAAGTFVSAPNGSPATASPAVPVVGGGGAASVYIVQLAGAPVLSYDGGARSMPATRPAAGKRVNPKSRAVEAYVDHLDDTQRAVAAVVGSQPLYHYNYAFNGFATRIDASAAERLRATPGVLAVTRSERLHLDTATTPDFLGLSGPDGLWSDLGGTGIGGAGSGIVIGVIDSGVTPSAASFSDPDPSGNPYPAPTGWSGTCQAGTDFDATDCSNKLIGARYYNAGYGGNTAVLADSPHESISPIDVDGHGTHVASTAAGNSGTPAVVGGFDFGEMSGMAPRAHLAVYKVCWGRGVNSGCDTSDALAAIEQAVADGVDVINYSISGSRTTSLGPVELAFLAAADSGVFVATSAGNDGDNDGAGSVAHPSPWVTTVAAGSHPRSTTATVTLGNGVILTGASLTTVAVGPTSFVSSVDVGLAGAGADDVRLCALDALDPVLVAGKIVLCQRGVVARVEKSAAVAVAGGVGMVLANVTSGTLNADVHSVPSVHLPAANSAALIEYASSVDATAAISVATVSNDLVGFVPALADFSSFGPSQAHGADILKPDITAPGVDVIAAVSPLNGGASVGVESGTSMSSPHIAGLAALMLDLHPDWSPMMIKSAFMTTAKSLAGSDGTHDGLDPHDYGAGYVVPISAADPGLVYDSEYQDWLSFLCGGDVDAEFCEGTTPIDPSDLNLASISIGSLGSRQTIFRRVTNVGPPGSYAATIISPAGFEAVVNPPVLTLATGQTASFNVTFVVDPDAVTYGTFTFGSLVWSDGAHQVRSPIAVKAEQLGGAALAIAPVFVDLCGVSGDTVTLAAVDGLSYVVNDLGVASGISPGVGATTITVVADDGFYLVGEDDYWFTFTDQPCPGIVAVSPARMLDTRPSPTIDNTFSNVGRLSGGSVTAVKIAGRGGVPVGAVGVVANLTAILPDAAGFATLYPCSASTPTASTVNYQPGDVVANNTIVALNEAGEVCVFTLGTADFALDVTGYIPDGSELVPFTPRRYLDTRSTIDTPTFDQESSGVGRLGAGREVEVQVAGRGGVPASAHSVLLNVTAITPSAAGFITVHSCGDRPATSNINYFAGQFVPNGVVVELSDTGTLCVYSSASTDLAIDVSGWISESSSVKVTAPARFLDTRSGAEHPTIDGLLEGGGQVDAGQLIEVQISGRNGVPVGAIATLVNLAVVFPQAPGFATLYPCGTLPRTSSVNHIAAGTVRANNAVVKLSPNGTVCIFSLAASDVILDVTGWVN